MAIHEITFHGRYTNVAVETRNTFYAGNLVSSYGDALVTASYILSAFYPNLAAHWSQFYEWYGYTIRDVTNVGSVGIWNELSPALSGTNLIHMLPPQVALYISLKAGGILPNKSPKWMAGFTEQDSVEGVPSAGLLADMVTALGDLLAASNVSSDVQKLACVQWDSPPTHVVSANPIQAWYLNPLFRTQRRRAVGIGI